MPTRLRTVLALGTLLGMVGLFGADRRQSREFARRATVPHRERALDGAGERLEPEHGERLGRRTNYRGERVFLYRLRGSPDLARRLLLSYLGEIDQLSRAPRWYNALTHNCTTTIRIHAQEAEVRNPLDWRLFANGKGDELLYERGDVDTSLPLAELRARSDITGKARAADQDARFSSLIRDGLPPRPSAAR
jgi:Domain of unknown function (DUF4105)